MLKINIIVLTICITNEQSTVHRREKRFYFFTMIFHAQNETSFFIFVKP